MILSLELIRLIMNWRRLRMGSHYFAGSFCLGLLNPGNGSEFFSNISEQRICQNSGLDGPVAHRGRHWYISVADPERKLSGTGYVTHKMVRIQIHPRDPRDPSNTNGFVQLHWLQLEPSGDETSGNVSTVVQAFGCCVCLVAKGMALGSWLGTTRLERTALFGRAVVGYGGICGLAIRTWNFKGKFLVKNLPWKSLLYYFILFH